MEYLRIVYVEAYAEAYKAAYITFLSILCMLFVLEHLPYFITRRKALGANFLKNVSYGFSNKRVEGGFKHKKIEEGFDVEDDPTALIFMDGLTKKIEETITEEGRLAATAKTQVTDESKMQTDMAENDKAVAEYLSQPHYYFGIEDIFFPNGDVSFFGIIPLKPKSPGMAEDFLYHIYNYDPLVSCFAADDNNPNSRLLRKLLLLVDLSVAFFIYCCVETANLGDLSILVQLLIGLFMSYISKVTYYIFMCACLAGTKYDSTQKACHKNMKVNFIVMFVLSMALIAFGVKLMSMMITPKRALLKVGLFYLLVFLLDTAKRFFLLQYPFNSESYEECCCCNIVLVHNGQWLEEKYYMGCVTMDEYKNSYSNVFCCIKKTIMTVEKDNAIYAEYYAENAKAIARYKLEKEAAVGFEKCFGVTQATNSKTIQRTEAQVDEESAIKQDNDLPSGSHDDNDTLLS